jgi:hypothetical protein
MEPVRVLISLGIIIALIAIIAIVFYLQICVTKKFKDEGILNPGVSERTTYFLDEGEDERRCDICYGVIENEEVAICGCGKLFHRACAEPTDICPYCGMRYSEMEVREPRRARCPVCGRFVRGSICECGAVLPRRDRTFLCSCGNRVDVSKPVCRQCGAVYEDVTLHTMKRKS